MMAPTLAFQFLSLVLLLLMNGQGTRARDIKVELQDQQVEWDKATLVSNDLSYDGGYTSISESTEPNYLASYTTTTHNHHHQQPNHPCKTTDVHKPNKPSYITGYRTKTHESNSPYITGYRTKTHESNAPYITGYRTTSATQKSRESSYDDATKPYKSQYGGTVPNSDPKESSHDDTTKPYITAYGTASSNNKPKESSQDDTTKPYITAYGSASPTTKPYITAYGSASPNNKPKESSQDDTTKPYITAYGSANPTTKPYITAYGSASPTTKPYITEYGSASPTTKPFITAYGSANPTTKPYITAYGSASPTTKPYITAYGSTSPNNKPKESSQDDTTKPYITSYGSASPNNKPKDSSNIDHTEAFKTGFFALDDLYVGNVMTLQFPIQEVSRFLPRKDAEPIPFSTSQLPSVLQLFSLPEDSPEANAMRDTLEQCESPTITGETKICATSLESMLEFVNTIIGSEAKHNIVTTSYPTTSSVPLQKYTILEISEDINAPKWVACHPLPYPYAIYFCHFIATGSKVFKVSLGGENDNKIEALGICHLDTSDWNPDHVVFRQLGITAGKDPVCHFFPVNHLMWVPQPSQATM